MSLYDDVVDIGHVIVVYFGLSLYIEIIVVNR